MSNNIHHTAIFTNPVSEPLPHLIVDSIREAILDGRLSPGEQLPSEPAFSTQLGVSRTTLRDALHILINDGVLERRRGVGTFVASNALIHFQEGLETLVGTTELIRKQGYQPGTAETRWGTTSASETLAEIFGIPPESKLLHISRTRTANGIPVIHSEEYLPADLLSSDTVDRLEGDWSLYELLDSSNHGVVSAVSKVIPIAADESLAARLHVKVSHPLLLLRQTHYSHDRQPVLYCENFHNSTLIDFHVLRKR